MYLKSWPIAVPTSMDYCLFEPLQKLRCSHLLFRRTHLLFRHTHLLFQRVHNAPYETTRRVETYAGHTCMYTVAYQGGKQEI